MKVSKEFKRFLKKPKIQRTLMVLEGAKAACVSVSNDFVEDLWLDQVFYPEKNCRGYVTWRMDTFPCGITVTYSDDFFRP